MSPYNFINFFTLKLMPIQYTPSKRLKSDDFFSVREFNERSRNESIDQIMNKKIKYHSKQILNQPDELFELIINNKILKKIDSDSSLKANSSSFSNLNDAMEEERTIFYKKIEDFKKISVLPRKIEQTIKLFKNVRPVLKQKKERIEKNWNSKTEKKINSPIIKKKL